MDKTGNNTAPYLTEEDTFLFHEGTNREAYLKMGAHLCRIGGECGTLFTVWAPNAKNVSVITSATGWNEEYGSMKRNADGVYEQFISGVKKGDSYRFVITGADGVKRYKADPYAFFSEKRPENASIVWPLDSYEWHDTGYMNSKPDDPEETLKRPVSIYEVHPGSWKKNYENGPDGFINYRELGRQLAEYCEYMGYTHAELMGICEHPLDDSWGYQVTGYYSPTSRYGTPDDFRALIDCLHEKGIGVILDWVPAHFPKDDYSLSSFDGTKLYEPEDPLRAEYPEWGTLAFDHSKPEVRSFLISNAFYWIREFHIDALRVDAVASMLYLNFGRSRFSLNKDGGIENYESTAFLKQLNKTVRENTKAYLTAEDSSILKGVTAPVSEGGLGFLYKWNMGWMNDTLKYIKRDPVYRKYHHSEITGTVGYSFLENFILVLSHDEVVHLKKSMLGKMPGNAGDRLGSLKAFYTLQFTHPGKKLLFMGQEFGDPQEWNEGRCLDWGLTHDSGHRDVMLNVKKLNEIYRKYPVLYTDTRDSRTFEWINSSDSDRNILSFIRRNPWNYNDALMVIVNLSPVMYADYKCGAPEAGSYIRIFSTYDELERASGAAGFREEPEILTEEELCDGRQHALRYALRPYEALILTLPEKKAAGG